MLKKPVIAIGLCAVMMAQLLSSLSIVSYAQGETVYINATFDNTPNGGGSFGNGGSLEGLTLIRNATNNTGINYNNFSVVEEPSEKDKSLKMNISTNTAGGTLYSQFAPVGEVGGVGIVILQTRVKVDADFYNNPDADFFRFGPLVSSDGSNWWDTSTYGHTIQFIAGNKLMFRGTQVGTWTKGNWYDIKLVYNLSDKSCTLNMKGDNESAINTSYTYSGMASNQFPFRIRTTLNASAGEGSSKTLGSVSQAYIRASLHSGWKLVSSTPENNKNDVDVNTNTISLTFDTPMRASSFNNFTIMGTSPAGSVPPVTYTIDSTNSQNNDAFTSCVLKTTAQLEHEAVYTIPLDSLVDLYGSTIASDVKSITFNTTPRPSAEPNLDVDFAKAKFYNGSDDITSSGLTAGNIRVSVPAKNQKNTAMNPVILFGLYEEINGKERLVKSSHTTANLQAGQEQVLSAQLLVAQDELKNSKLMVFVWSDIDSMVAEYDPLVFTPSGIQSMNLEGSNVNSSSPLTVNSAQINQDGLVTVSGAMNYKYRQISLLAVDANGKYNHIAQTITAVDGTFNFQYYLGTETPDGNCTIIINGAGAAAKWQSSGLTVNSGNAKPRVTNLSIIGQTNVNSVITASYDYFQASGKTEKNSEIQWSISSSANGTYAPIAGAVGKTYTIKNADAGKYLKYSVVPVSSAGVRGDAYSSGVVLVFETPAVENVSIRGLAQAGETLSGSYTFISKQNSIEKGSSYRWLKAGSANGDFTPILTATGLTYAVRDSDIGSYLKFEVTPAIEAKDINNNTVKVTGKPVQGSAVLIADRKSADGVRKQDKVKEEIWIDNPYFNKPLSEMAFTDIAEHWARESILSSAMFGFIEGTSHTVFSPELNVTRAEFIKGVVRILRIYPVKYNNTFHDIPADADYADTIQAAYQAGIIQGDNGNFYPNRHISREEMCVILIRALSKIDVTLSEKNTAQFADYQQISDWAKREVERAVAYGLINGMSDNYFYPKQNTTRAQAAVIFERLNNNIGHPSFTNPAYVPAEDATVSQTEKFKENNRNAALTLIDLGILEANIDEEGVIDTSVKIRRDEFIKLIMKATGTEDFAGVSELPFTDIDKNNSNYNYIGAALGAGYINRDDKFYPKRGVTVAQAVVMLTKLLGYEEYAMNNGGYPNGYYNVTQKTSMLKSMEANFSDNSILSVAEASQMLLNAMNQPILRITAVGNQIHYTAKKDETLSKAYLNIEKRKGHVTANEFTSIGNKNSLAPLESVVIDGENFEVGETNATDLLGHMVDYYVQTNEATDEKILLSITSSLDDIIKIQSRLIDSYYNLTLSYYQTEDSTSVSELNLSREADVIYNGLYWGMANNLTQGMIKPDVGFVEVLDTDKDGLYDLVIIKSYQTVVINHVDKENKVITDKFNEAYKLELDKTGVQTHYIVYKFGLNMTVSNLKQWDVLLICDSGIVNGKRIVMIEACTEKLTEPVESVSGMEKATFSGVEYHISPHFKNVSKTNTISVNDKGTFYLDSFNNIAAFQSATSTVNDYAILTAFGTPKSLSAKAEFKIFNSLGEYSLLNGAKIVYLNDEKYVMTSSNDADKLLAELKKTSVRPNTVVQLVKFELNSDGEMHKLYTALIREQADSKSVLVQENSSEKLKAKAQGGYLNFAGKFIWGANTVMFSVPNDVTNENGFIIPEMSSFIHDQDYYPIAYNLDFKSGVPEVILFNEIPQDIEIGSDLLVIEAVSMILSKDGEAVRKLSGLYRGVKGEWIAANSDVDAKAKDLKFGDAVRISLNGLNEISNIEKTLLMSQHEQTPLYMSGDYLQDLSYVYGIISSASREANTVAISTDLTGMTNIYYYPLSWVRIVVCDAQAKTVSIGTVNDLIENANGIRPDVRAFLKVNHAIVRDLVVFK